MDVLCQAAKKHASDQHGMQDMKDMDMGVKLDQNYRYQKEWDWFILATCRSCCD